jgi:G3E family GTPase
MTIPSPIPITVFTGFLGAGKTSIILSLLPKLPEDYKVVLLKNEFGDIEGKHLVFTILYISHIS